MKADILIRSGEVIDPSQKLRGVRDLAVDDGKIVALADKLTGVDAVQTIDARGLYVVPGLIDFHMHAFPVSPFGLEPDSLCAANGVTTMLDTGTAGSYNFEVFRRDIIDRSRTRVLALVNLSRMGLAAGQLGELRDRRYSDPEGAARLVERHPGIALGIKIRAGRIMIGEGAPAWESFKDAVRAARMSKSWLMVHIGDSPMTVPEMLEHMVPGDCITHSFKNGPGRITDDSGKVFSAVVDAQKRGILFDIGHGSGSFGWKTAEDCLRQGFKPNIISTDLHSFCIKGPVYDMPTTMSKFLLLGYPLEEVIAMTTLHPARGLGRENDLASLQIGRTADIALLERNQGRFIFTDAYKETRIGREWLRAAATIRSGQLVPGGGDTCGRHFAD